MAVSSAIGGFFRGLWHALDGLRKVLHLVVLLFIFGVLFAATRSSLPYVPGSAALVLAPQGRIVEQLSGDPYYLALGNAFGEQRDETRLQDLLDVIKAARKDDRITSMVLDLRAMDGAGLPELQDLAGAIDAFRAAGKKVFAWGSWYDQRQYYLAAHADEVYLDPFGAVVINGFGYFRQYLKGTADKLGVNVHVFKVGTYKSAPDTFTRSDMSANDRKAAGVWLGALWDAWKSGVAKARKLDPQSLQDYADKAAEGMRAAGGDQAGYALANGLVDGLKTQDQFDELVAKVAGTDNDTHSFRAVDWESYLSVLRSERALRKSKDHNVAVVVAEGEILDGDQPSGTVGGDTLSGMLRDLRFDDSVGAVVLRIDSPGGSMYAAEQIRREVAALQAAGKPVVASMGAVAASGGYYIAAPAEEIFASPATITGSIGVFAMFPTFEKTLDKLGITTDGIGTTALAGGMRPDRDISPIVGDVLQSGVEHAYHQFVAMVAESRHRPFDEIESLAQGRVWSGSDAKDAGLVDEFGNLDDAVKAAARLGKLPKGYGIDWVEPKLTWQQMLALRLRTAESRVLGRVGIRLDLPQLPMVPGPALVQLRNLLQLGQAGRPLYWCACRVE